MSMNLSVGDNPQNLPEAFNDSHLLEKVKDTNISGLIADFLGEKSQHHLTAALLGDKRFTVKESVARVLKKLAVQKNDMSIKTFVMLAQFYKAQGWEVQDLAKRLSDLDFSKLSTEDKQRYVEACDALHQQVDPFCKLEFLLQKGEVAAALKVVDKLSLQTSSCYQFDMQFFCHMQNLLYHPNIEVSLKAIEKLADLSLPEVTDFIMQLLKESNPEILLQGIKALRSKEHPNLEQDLIALVQHPDPRIQVKALEELSLRENPLAFNFLLQFLESQSVGLQELDMGNLLAKTGGEEKAYPILQVFLNSPNSWLQQMGIQGFETLGNHVDELKNYFISCRSLPLKLAALEGIQKDPSEATTQWLQAVIKDGHPDVQLAGLKAIIKREPSVLFEELQKALKSQNQALQQEAIAALGEIGSPEALELLVQKATEPATFSCAALSKALLKHATEEKVQKAFLEMEKALNTPEGSGDIQAYTSVLTGLLKNSFPKVELLFLKQLQSPHPSIRKLAMQRFEKSQSYKLIERMMEKLNDPDPSVRNYLVSLLVDKNSPLVFKVLKKLTLDPNPEVANNAAKGLLKSFEKSHLLFSTREVMHRELSAKIEEDIQALKQHSLPIIRKQSAETWGRIGGIQGLRNLKDQLLKEQSPEVIEAIFQSLIHMV